MPEQLRINFFGAPARGKSNIASWIFSQLRFGHINAELVQEWIKTWAYAHRPVQQFDQIYIFGKQHHMEYELLKAGVKNIVTDSPIWLSVFYAPPDLKRGIAELIREYEQEYPALNILLLKDKDAEYEREGRYQDAGGAQRLEDTLIDFMYETMGISNFKTFRFSQQEAIKNAVLEAVIK
jgi:hypothetical protein